MRELDVEVPASWLSLENELKSDFHSFVLATMVVVNHQWWWSTTIVTSIVLIVSYRIVVIYSPICVILS